MDHYALFCLRWESLLAPFGVSFSIAGEALTCQTPKIFSFQIPQAAIGLIGSRRSPWDGFP